MTIRTLSADRVTPLEPALSAASSRSYLVLLLAVVGPNAGAIRGAPGTVALVAAAGLVLNLFGYGLAAVVGRGLADPTDRTALLFTVSKKEFSIAAVVVFSSGLPARVALPAAVYAVVQMLAAPWLPAHWPTAPSLHERCRSDPPPRRRPVAVATASIARNPRRITS